MNKKYNLKLDLQFRCNNSTMKFNQFDNNTSDFFMRITNGGNLVDIEKALVVLAVIKPSGKVSSQFVEVENGLVYADLKPNMKDEIGTYTARAMLILEDERVVTDAISYEVEEDKIFSLLNDTVETTEEFTLLTDMLNRLSTIEISEEQRVINEAERISNENSRKANEVVREKNEATRQNTFTNKVNEVDKKISEINITKDKFISSINTKVDTKISEIDNSKSDMTATVSNKIDEVESRFNALTTQQQQDAEVIDARDGETSLKARLDRDIEKTNKELDKIKKLEESTVSTVETESDFTTVEATSNGYFEDVKLEGKTLVVNDSNEIVEPGTEGATLKSVGQDVDEIVVSSVNGDGNLVEYMELNGVIIADGKDYTDGKYVRTNYITVEPNQTYYIKPSTNVLYERCVVYFYDSNKSYLGYKNGLTSEFTTVTNTKFIRLDMKKADDSANTQEDINNCDFVVSKCRVSEYIPYQSDKKPLLYYNNETQTWEKPILREWDSIEKHADGKYYYHQRSGEVAFDGSEDWGARNMNNENNTIGFGLYPGLPNYDINSLPPIICDRFACLNANALWAFDEEGTTHAGDYLHIRILKSKLSTQDAEGFKQWLQANNVTVVYQLAQEKVYECTNIDLITYEGETNYVVESGAIAPKTTLKVHNNISNVVSLLQKKVSLLESNITSYIITQNRLMLASRYNADSVSFKVDVASYNNSFEYDNDLYNLILNNILVGKDNYNREYIENLIIFYWMDFVISDEMHSTLFEIIEEQHNPKIVEDQEEAPLI